MEHLGDLNPSTFTDSILLGARWPRLKFCIFTLYEPDYHSRSCIRVHKIQVSPVKLFPHPSTTTFLTVLIETTFSFRGKVLTRVHPVKASVFKDWQTPLAR